MTPRQDVRFCTAADGTRIAVASIGSGPPLVRAAHWLSHVERDLESPVWRPWVQELSRHHTYIRYDQRGCGLSDRTLAGLSLDNFVGDLETVVDQLGLERFPLIGMSQGGAVAMRYASRHPERVSALVLVGAYARGALRRRRSDLERLEADTLVNLIRVGWGRDNDAFRQVFTNQYIPEGTAEQHRWWNDLERISASPEGAARTLAAFHDADVTEAAASLRVPTLVVHFAPRCARSVRRRPPPRGADPRCSLPRPRERQPRPARIRAGLAGVRRGAVRLPRRDLGIAPDDDERGRDAAHRRRGGGARAARARPRQPRHRAPARQEREDGAQPGLDDLRQARRTNPRRGDRARDRRARAALIASARQGTSVPRAGRSRGPVSGQAPSCGAGSARE
jgi:pimeloyl-ACP methyl ester carboxylesterase